jgi:hypothetical protein
MACKTEKERKPYSSALKILKTVKTLKEGKDLFFYRSCKIVHLFKWFYMGMNIESAKALRVV